MATPKDRSGRLDILARALGANAPWLSAHSRCRLEVGHAGRVLMAVFKASGRRVSSSANPGVRCGRTASLRATSGRLEHVRDVNRAHGACGWLYPPIARSVSYDRGSPRVACLERPCKSTPPTGDSGGRQRQSIITSTPRPGTDVLSGLSVVYPTAGRGPGPRPDPFSH